MNGKGHRYCRGEQCIGQLAIPCSDLHGADNEVGYTRLPGASAKAKLWDKDVAEAYLLK